MRSPLPHLLDALLLAALLLAAQASIAAAASSPVSSPALDDLAISPGWQRGRATL